MRIGFISTRLSGTDGVSLEVEKWGKVLARMGHELFYCAGELGGYASGGTLIPLLHFSHQTIYSINQRAFGEQAQENPEGLIGEIYAVADEIRPQLRNFIRQNKLDLVIVQNALAIPMNLPLGVSLAGLIAELGCPTIAHHHDFFWERERFSASQIFNLLDTTFPATLPSIRHVTINTIAQQRLRERRSIDSVVVPNVHDFASPAPGIDGYNQDLREAIGLGRQELFVFQPTRVIRRKGIELALMLLSRMELEAPKLVIAHSISDEGQDYWQYLVREAQAMGVKIKLINDFVNAQRAQTDGHKIYSLWDVYPQVDLVTYPSTYEGFGNALLEAIYFKRLTVVNRYPVYNTDIRPLGFQFVEVDGLMADGCLAETKRLLNRPDEVKEITKKNYEIAKAHFSFEVLEEKLSQVLESF